MFSNNYFSPNNLSLIFFPSSNLFLACYLSSSSLEEIYFRSSPAFFFTIYFFYDSNFNSSSRSYFWVMMILWNSSLSILAYSCNIYSFSYCYYRLASNSSWFIWALCSASIYSFFRAFLSFYSMALLALNWSNSDYLSLAFSYISLNLYNSFSFSSLIRFYSAYNSAAF